MDEQSSPSRPAFEADYGSPTRYEDPLVTPSLVDALTYYQLRSDLAKGIMTLTSRVADLLAFKQELIGYRFSKPAVDYARAIDMRDILHLIEEEFAEIIEALQQEGADEQELLKRAVVIVQRARDVSQQMQLMAEAYEQTDD